MPNNPNAVDNLKPFVKGDPRINRKGRPKNFDGLRGLAKQIAHEVAKTTGGQEVVINGKKVTVTEMILRQWAQSKNPHLQQKFIEVAFGKTPDIVELGGRDGGELVFRVVYDEKK